MILLYCFDIEERVYLHSYFKGRGVRMEATPPSEFRIRSYALSTDAIIIAGRMPNGFISDLNPDVPLITIGKYALGDSINFRTHTDPTLLELLSSFYDSDQSFEYNDVLYGTADKTIYLGYELKLTETERAILSFIVLQKERDVLIGEIAETCIGETHLRDFTVRKHISSINLKAFKLGGRTLIYSSSPLHYRMKKYI